MNVYTKKVFNGLINLKSINDVSDLIEKSKQYMYADNDPNKKWDYLRKIHYNFIDNKNNSGKLFLKYSSVNIRLFSDYVNNKKIPSRDMLIKFCFGYRLSIDELNELLKEFMYCQLYIKDTRDVITAFGRYADITIPQVNFLLSLLEYDVNDLYSKKIDNDISIPILELKIQQDLVVDIAPQEKSTTLMMKEFKNWNFDEYDNDISTFLSKYTSRFNNNFYKNMLDYYLNSNITNKASVKNIGCFTKSKFEKRFFTNDFINKRKIEIQNGQKNSNLQFKKSPPSRDDVIRFGFGLKLNQKDINRLLEKAGYLPLYPRYPRDLVVLYFLINQKYDIREIDDVLSDLGYSDESLFIKI